MIFKICRVIRQTTSVAQRLVLLGFAAICMIASAPSIAAPPSILLANVLGPNVDVTQYLVSEKFDGVRAIWDGKTLRFRSGRDVAAPRWFIEKLPPEPLDGELWIARGRFDELSGLVRKHVPDDTEWRRVQYLIFEWPQSENSPTMSFSDRVAQLKLIVERANFPALKVVDQFRVKDRAELKRKLDAVVKSGGEGLMLHLADAPYVTGRSDVLLKLKPLLDTEATVIEHLPGKGKHAGKMGALMLETKSGVRFKLGTGFSDAMRANPPDVGALVTYAYRDVTPQGKPRFASFVRVRDDP
jgi:DNA ligase 1